MTSPLSCKVEDFEQRYQSPKSTAWELFTGDGISTCNWDSAFPYILYINLLSHSILRPAGAILSEALALLRVVTCGPTGP